MNICFLGNGPLAQILESAAERRGFVLADVSHFADLVFVAKEVDDHRSMEGVCDVMQWAVDNVSADVPIIVTSQVPPGWTRPWAHRRPGIYYQPHTLIRGQETDMAYAPDCLVVGSGDVSEPLPAAYVEYLAAYEAPVHRMSFESAELSKLAVNYLLAAHITASNQLAFIASQIGADWDEIVPSLRYDKRIGEHAYIRPGVIGGHLPRDVDTVNRLKATLQ